MTRTPVQQGEDARRFDEAMQRASERSPEEKQTAFVATALFSKRADGRIEPLSAADAAGLLGQIGSYSTGQGAFNLLVPVRAVTSLGLDAKLWDKAAKLRPSSGDQPTQYDLDYMTGVEFISRLEVLSGKTWNEATALRATTQSTRDSGITR